MTRSENESNAAGRRAVGPAYFETMGTRLVAGRAIGERDTETAPLVSVINEAMAARYWQTSDRAIGRRFKTRRDGPGIEVMSVAKNGKYMSFGEGATPYYFVPLGQNYTGRVTVLVRSRESLPALMPSVRQQISGLDPHIARFRCSYHAGLPTADPFDLRNGRILDRNLCPHGAAVG